MCAFNRVMSAESAAGAVVATATIAAGTSARANFVGKVIRCLLGFRAENWRFPVECALNLAGSGPLAAHIRVAVGVDQHLAPPDMIRLPDESGLLHPLDQPRGVVVADSKLPLEV